MSSANESQTVAPIREGVRGRNSLIYLVSPEEDRVIALIRQVAREELGAEAVVSCWSCVSGLDGADPGTTDPLVALQTARHDPRPGCYVMRDLCAFLDRPEVVRALRDTYRTFQTDGRRFLMILSPRIVVPELVEKELLVIRVPPPDDHELAQHLQTVKALYPTFDLVGELQAEVILALKGLTLQEVTHIMHRVCRGDSADRANLLDQIFREKEMIVRRSGYLEFVVPRWNVAGIGGLDNLKEWLAKRKSVFNSEAVAAGVPIPKGLLLMGISGCGKSLAAKAISSLWNLPLFRLDMNLIFSGMYGTPEATFHHALRTVETVAPSILWIDEIENGLGAEEGRSGSNQHIFSAFLTWMQEKPPLVFIAATANRIQDLPAEVIRKGRFDQVFFCDLPTAKERRQIFEIHLVRNAVDLAGVDMEYLGVVTEGWNGAEIEQAVVSARVEAYHDKRAVDMQDLNRCIGTIVPLSKTMEEQIKRIRSWAFNRATPASRFARERRA